MARPNSKYFASVITKILASKRKENIEVDESFKMMLRSDLLTRAANTLGKQKKESVAENFFARWKYVLAAVPSALVITIVAAQFLNMPAVVPPEELSRTEVSESQNEQVQPVEEDTSENNDVQQQPERSTNSGVVAVNESGKQVRTFPGSLVLGSTQGAQVSETPETATGTVEVSESDNSQEQESPRQQQQVSPQPLSFQLFGLNVNLSGENSSASSSSRNSISGAETEVEEQDEEPTIVNVEGVPSENNQAVQPVGQAVIASVPETQLVGDAKPDQSVQRVAADGAQPINVVENSEIVQPPSAQMIQTEQVAQPVQSIHYATSLSSTAMEKMEAKVVPSLVGGRTTNSVTVSEKESGVVAVNVVFADGQQIEKFYTFNERTKAWDHVEYVTRSYYDDGLSYTTNFTYSR